MMRIFRRISKLVDRYKAKKHREKMQEEYETFFKLVRDGILLPEQAADRLHISLREFRERYDAGIKTI